MPMGSRRHMQDGLKKGRMLAREAAYELASPLRSCTALRSTRSMAIRLRIISRWASACTVHRGLNAVR